jgi:hypothetical protein
MDTNTGLTIAFICNGDKHPTVINYKLFGNKYWDDTQNNKSKIGYYFAYYFQQKYVYIHKIINILQPSEQPSDMIWESNKNRQILCLSKQLKKFTWNEWITGIGTGTPYTPKYCMTQTGSWSYSELQKKYNMFNFINFINTIETQPTVIKTPLLIDDEECEYEELVEDVVEDSETDEEVLFELNRKKRQEIQDEEDRQQLIKIRVKKIRANLHTLREHAISIIYAKNTELQLQIDLLIAERDKCNQEIDIISQGGCDDELIVNAIKEIKLTIK